MTSIAAPSAISRSHRSPSLLGLVLLTLVAGVSVAQDFSQVQLEEIKLNDSLYMVTGAGGNLGISVGEDGILLIDDQFAPLVERIRDKAVALSKNAGHPRDEISYVINTHWHFDHTGGNEGFGLEAAILAHEAVRTRMEAGAELPRPVPPAPKVALPILTFKQSVSLHWNGEEVQVIHFPSAHTDGDSVVFFTQSNVVHMGDHFFNGGTFPFVDLASGGNALGLAENIGKILTMLPDDVKIIPGHGPLGDKADLERYHRMLNECIAHVKRSKDAGKSLEEAQAAGVPEEWKSLGEGGGFIDTRSFVGFIYSSLN